MGKVVIDAPENKNIFIKFNCMYGNKERKILYAIIKKNWEMCPLPPPPSPKALDLDPVKIQTTCEKQ